eukprot:gb/GFBE01034874.1/.p1 GENE.gb/GFBE01034874.1/~~gb/GFBE01034874.1/.p1  ORF type:complete len:184 (+),score=27.19 gb/GFBE01034874.1/:1-552(+)
MTQIPALTQMVDPTLRVQVCRTFIEVADMHSKHLCAFRSRSTPPRIMCEQREDRAAAAAGRGADMQRTAAVEKREQKDIEHEHGVPPDDPRWTGMRKIVIKNLPARCSHGELCDFIAELLGSPRRNSFHVHLPPSTGKGKRNNGFAFVTLHTVELAQQLVNAMWMKSIPSRPSNRILRLTPKK